MCRLSLLSILMAAMLLQIFLRPAPGLPSPSEFFADLDSEERTAAESRGEWLEVAHRYLMVLSEPARESLWPIIYRQAAGLSLFDHPSLRDSPSEHLLEGRHLMVMLIHPYPEGPASLNGKIAYGISSTLAARSSDDPEDPNAQFIEELALVFALKGAFVDFHDPCVLEATAILNRLAHWSRLRQNWCKSPLVVDWRTDIHQTSDRLRRLHENLDPAMTTDPRIQAHLRHLQALWLSGSTPPNQEEPGQNPRTHEERVEALVETTIELLVADPKKDVSP